MCVQYIGGYHEYIGGYHEYIEGYHEYIGGGGGGVFSTSEDIMSTSGEGGTMSTTWGYYEYIRRCSSGSPVHRGHL